MVAVSRDQARCQRARRGARCRLVDPQTQGDLEYKVGPGWSSFVVAGNRLFTQEQRGKNEDVVCYDAKTGEERWVQESPEARFAEAMGGVGPRATPALSGGQLYVQGATGLLLCLDPLTGTKKWEHDLMKEAARTEMPRWGYSYSPLVVGDTIFAYAAAGGAGGGGVKGPGSVVRLP